jgi:hypothetical protein
LRASCNHPTHIPDERPKVEIRADRRPLLDSDELGGKVGPSSDVGIIHSVKWMRRKDVKANRKKPRKEEE